MRRFSIAMYHVRTEGVGSREDREQTDEIEQMTEGVWSQEQ